MFAVDVAKPRLSLLPKGPTVVALHALECDIRARVRDANHGRRVDVTFGVTGYPKLIADEFKVLWRQGRFIVLSITRSPTPSDFHDLSNAPSFTIIGTHEMPAPAVPTPDSAMGSFFVEKSCRAGGGLITQCLWISPTPPTVESALEITSWRTLQAR